MLGNQLRVSRDRPLLNFSWVWFPDERNESARARCSNQMSLNTRYSVVTHVGFYIFYYVPINE